MHKVFVFVLLLATAGTWASEDTQAEVRVRAPLKAHKKLMSKTNSIAPYVAAGMFRIMVGGVGSYFEPRQQLALNSLSYFLGTGIYVMGMVQECKDLDALYETKIFSEDVMPKGYYVCISIAAGIGAGGAYFAVRNGIGGKWPKEVVTSGCGVLASSIVYRIACKNLQQIKPPLHKRN